MDGYSGFGGTSGITPATERVWAVQKKRKTEDHRRRKERNDFGKGEKREEEVKRAQVMEHVENRHETDNLDEEEELVYGSGKPTTSKSRKIDLFI